MAKTRMLKHDLRTSEKVASWPIEIRYFWVLLWGYLDDHGKAKDNPLLAKADTFPLDPDITGEVIDGWLWRIAEDGVIARYTVDGTDYLAAVNWTEHQKPPHPTKDVLPAYDDPRATRRELHASRMKDAGEPSAPLTHGLGWVGSGFGSVNGSSPTAMVLSEPQLSFSAFWTVWPKSNGKKAAEAAWAKAIKRASPEAIVQAAKDYANSPHRPAIQFVPYGATWLNGDLWEDDLPQAPELERKLTRTEQNLDFVAQLAAEEAQNQRGIEA